MCKGRENCSHTLVKWSAYTNGIYRLVCCICGKLFEDETWTLT